MSALHPPVGVTIRRGRDRGETNLGWLESYHTFSFGEYVDREHHHFSNLRVINDDIIAPGAGFDMHPHRDMEILTYVLEGEVAHRDSTGGEGVTRVGEIQRMTAGSGILHSEFNASTTSPLHLLQVWILPVQKGLTPGYEQRAIEWSRPWTVLAAPVGRGGTVAIAADARLLAARLTKGQDVLVEQATGRSGWLHVAAGEVRLGEQLLAAGDAAAIVGEQTLTVTAVEAAEVLLFDLPAV